jgi:adenosylcobinamide amidohydrolase
MTHDAFLPRGAEPISEDSRTDQYPMSVTCARPWLVVRFREEHTVMSWAIVGGGIRRAQCVAWHEVNDRELRPPVDAGDLLRSRLASARLRGSVGLLTSRRVDTYSDVDTTHGDVSARCIATVGLGNALRAGDLPGESGRIGTINLLCRVSRPLTSEAQLEVLSLAAEARTLAVLEAGVPSRRSGLRATGTGTDCIVIASPSKGSAAPYAGKHTEIGHVVGASVERAVRLGVTRWLDSQGIAAR